jgi:hypothetical protein
MRFLKSKNLLIVASLCIAVAYLPMTCSVLADDDDEDFAAVQDADNSSATHEHVVRVEVAKRFPQHLDIEYEFIFLRQLRTIHLLNRRALCHFPSTGFYLQQFHPPSCAKRPPPITANV